MDVKAALSTLGWRTNTSVRLAQAVRDFQRAWNLGPALAVDGIAGPATVAALEESMARKAAGRPDISEHFSAVEFRCACGGSDSSCRRIWPRRELIGAVEVYRAEVGPLGIERGCRCPTQNARVGGAKNSQHLYGSAADVSVYRVSVAKVQALRVASGIGTYTWGGIGYPRHIDVRHVFKDARNTTGSTVASPARWNYGAAKSAPLAPRPVMDPPPAPVVKPPAAPSPLPLEVAPVFLVKQDSADPVYKSDGFRRVHIDAIARDALLKAGARLTSYPTAAELEAFGPVVTIAPEETP